MVTVNSLSLLASGLATSQEKSPARYGLLAGGGQKRDRSRRLTCYRTITYAIDDAHCANGSAVAQGKESKAGSLRQWLADENGADLIEYMLLAGFLAIAGWLGMQALGTNMNNSYRIWDYNAQQLWEPPPPVSP